MDQHDRRDGRAMGVAFGDRQRARHSEEILVWIRVDLSCWCLAPLYLIYTGNIASDSRRMTRTNAYRHGNLRAALIEASLEILEERDWSTSLSEPAPPAPVPVTRLRKAILEILRGCRRRSPHLGIGVSMTGWCPGWPTMRIAPSGGGAPWWAMPLLPKRNRAFSNRCSRGNGPRERIPIFWTKPIGVLRF